jgi:uncharacterized protein (DUF1800 family)
MNDLIPQTKVKHLMSRGSFGWAIQTEPQDIRLLFKHAEKVTQLQSIAKPDLEQMDMRMNPQGDSMKRQVLKDFLSKSRENLMKVNQEWMNQIIADPSLRERMTFFWHGHFACRTLVPYFAMEQNNTMRSLALGSFRDLLLAVSKEPAMLQFLNNQQNRKGHPNENFAREVMELFTLGRGNYTELDVKEAARAFTGWSFDYQGDFLFRYRQHDSGVKSFRGKVKNFKGEEILDAILEDRTTAHFITTKLYRQLVSDQNLNPATIQAWADSFYKSDYNIEKLLRTIFQSDEFNSNSNIGNKIKSPIELLIGMQLHTAGKYDNPQSMIFLQRALGQIAFYPPNVSGWPSGQAWIDSSSLAFRIALPMMLFGGAETDFEASDDGDANGLGKIGKGKRNLHCKVDWENMANTFTKSSQKETLDLLESYLLTRPTSPDNKNFIINSAPGTTNDKDFVKRAFIGLMSLPEYQLC